MNVKSIKNKVLPRTLFGRSLMIILTPMLLLQMVVAIVFFDRHWDTTTDRLISALTGEVALAVMAVETAQNGDDIQRIVRQFKDTLNFEVFVEPGTLKEMESQTPRPYNVTWYSIHQRLHASLQNKVQKPFYISAHDRDRWFQIKVQLDEDRVIRIVYFEKRLTSATTYIFILWLIASGTLLIALAAIFMRNQIRPIRRLAVAANKFGKGQDIPNFKVEGATEVRQAAQAFIEMRDRLKRQIEQRTAMLAGVSHDLRTPLTRMKLQLAMSKTAEVENLRQDIGEMEKMIEGYLIFAKGEGDEAPEMIDLRSVLERIIMNAEREGHQINTQFSGGKMMLKVRPIAMERALSNIVTNACKYARQVWMETRAEPDAFEIIVEDDGPGIPEDLREEVFRPFYRVEKSRNKETGGIGLGLSIAQDIVHGHGGDITLDDSPHGGTRVLIRLPY